MPTRYVCTNCQGTFIHHGGPPPVCENGLGPMAVVDPSTAPPTGCKKGKQRFLASRFELACFVPSTARGKFDCSYNPRTGILDIVVRLCPTFGGSFFEKFSSDEKETISRNLIESVPVYWNGRCTFRCTRHGWTDIVVRPVFSVEFGGGNSHFKMIVSHEDERAKKNPHGRECRGFVSIDQVTSPSATDRLELRDFQTREFNHSVGGLLTAGNDREFLENALRACGAEILTGPPSVPYANLPFGDSSTEASALAPVLRNFVTAANRQLPGSHPIPVLLKGFTKLSEPALLGRRRAEAVEGVLRSANLKNPITVLPEVGTGKCAVELRIDRDFEASFALGQREFQYNVAAHEFGHMIGLPDEYENPDAGPKLIVKTNYNRLVARAKLIGPVFPSHTSSMMSDGMTTLNWHYVTAWEALGALTGEFLYLSEWAIHAPGA